jgi:hypothetical protein
MYRHSLSAALFYESDFTRKNNKKSMGLVSDRTSLQASHPSSSSRSSRYAQETTSCPRERVPARTDLLVPAR